MPKIKPYNKLLLDTELGEDAILTIDYLDWDVAKMTFRDMLINHEHMIRAADKVVLSSSDIGEWKYNHDSKKWERRRI